MLSYDNKNSRNTGVSGAFSCPKTGFSLIFSLIGSTGGNCTDKTLHAVGTFALHLVGHMTIYTQCEGGSGVAQIPLYCLDVVSGADRGGGKCRDKNRKQKRRKNLPAISASYDPSCVCSIVQFWWPPVFREAHFDILRVLSQSEKLLIRL